MGIIKYLVSLGLDEPDGASKKVKPGKILAAWMTTSKEEQNEIQRFMTDVFGGNFKLAEFQTNYPLMAQEPDLIANIGSLVDTLLTDENVSVIASGFLKND